MPASITNRYLSNLDDTRNTSRFFSTSPLRENKNILNSGSNSDLNVAGLKNRKKLALKDPDENLGSSWFDNERHSLQGYEYLCRVGEAKRWIEKCIGEELPPESELCNDGFRDGVILAKLTKVFIPDLVKKIIPSSRKLQFRHTENINNFFKFLDIIQIPELFRFELTDLYDKKNIPKVIFCIHALSFLLAQDEKAPKMTELVGKLEFTDEEISASQQALNGASLPNFSQVKRNDSDKSSSAAYQNEEHHERPAPVSRTLDPKPKSKARSRPKKVKATAPPPPPPKPSEEELDLVILSVIKFQCLARGSLLRYHRFVQKMVLEESSPFIETLQAMYRGGKLRSGPLATEFKIQSATPFVIQVQSKLRGDISRKVLRHKIRKLRKSSASFTMLQAGIRGEQLRNKLLSKLDTLTVANVDAITVLQAAIRRKSVASQLESHVRRVGYAKVSLTELYSVCRGQMLRKSLERQYRSLDLASVAVSKLQAIMKTRMFKKQYLLKMHEIKSNSEAITGLQAHIRALLVRRNQSKLSSSLLKSKSLILSLQSISRGGKTRSKYNRLFDKLELCEKSITAFNSIAKGVIARREFKAFIFELNKFGTYSATHIQAVTRGLLSRFQQDLLLDELEECEVDVTEVQALIRGALKRNADLERDAYYLANVDKVIKIQAYIKGKDFGDAYKKLLVMEDPPISVISKFAYLLNDTDKDFEDEVYLDQLNAKILQKTSEIEGLENTTKELDIKIALLVKNKISLDELVRQRNNGYTGYKVKKEPVVGALDINSLDKVSRSRVEVYQKLFYLLQTEPQYLVKIVTRFEAAKGLNKSIHQTILKLFNYGQLPLRKITTSGLREEFMMVRFLSSLITSNIQQCSDVSELASKFIENSGASWQKLFCAYIRSAKLKSVSKEIFGSLISSIAEIDNLSLESNPLKIYANISNKPANVSVEEIIKLPKVRDKFVENLAHLRELCNRFLELIWSSIDQIPLVVKTMMASIYAGLKSHFRDSIPDSLALSISGYVLVDLYLNNIISNPENYGITLMTLNSDTTLNLKANLAQITKILSQMVLMNPFPLEEVYLQPLNGFIQVQSAFVEKTLKRLTLKEYTNLEKTYDVSVLGDLSLYKKPYVTMDMEDLTVLTSLVEDNKDLFNPNDAIISLLEELDSLTLASKHNFKALVGAKEFSLELNPVVKDRTSTYISSKKNSLLIQAKRCVIYMLQVQSGRNLLDLLLSKIKSQDEEKFARIVSDESREKIEKNMYTNAIQGSLGDLTKMSYHDLKCLALEKILELESMGFLSRENNFQQLVTEIALDIKAKKEQRNGKQEYIKQAERVLKGVEEKEARLKRILEVYNDYIAKGMASLQTQPVGKKKKFPFFSKQYFYQKELRRQGKIPKFGSYKYSAKYLSDQGILNELSGIKCGVIGIELPKVDFMFSCDEVGVFLIEAASGSIPIPEAVAKLSLDDLLLHQYENKEVVNIYDGVVKFDTDTFLSFIFKKFYDNSI